MASIIVYGKDNCPHCDRALAHLDRAGVSYQYINLTRQPEHREGFLNAIGRPERPTVPQVFINGQYIGGADALCRMEIAVIQQMVGGA